MKVTIENLGNHAVRVITDDDPMHDVFLDAGATDTFEGEDIELRDFEHDEEHDDDEDSGTDSEPSST